MKSLIYKVSVLSCLFVVLAITYTYITNVNYAPDEGNHVYVVQHHVETLSLATWKEWEYSTYRGHAYHLYSPVPYSLHVLSQKFLNKLPIPGGFRANRQYYHARLAGLLWGAIQFFLTMLICREVFSSKWNILLASTAINFLPQLRYLHSYVNGDSFTIAVATLSVFLALRLLKRESVAITDTLLVGLVFSLILHGKYNGYLSAVILFSLFAYKVQTTEMSIGDKFRLLGLSLAVPAITVGWFFIHVFLELGNGHLLASEDHLALMKSTFHGETMKIAADNLVLLRISEVPRIWRSFIGWFVGHAELNSWYLVTTLGIILVGAFGWLVALFRKNYAFPKRAFLIFLCFGPIALLVSFVALGLNINLAIQGRLLIGTWVPLMLLVFGGFYSGLFDQPKNETRTACVCLLVAGFLFFGNVLLLSDFPKRILFFY